MPGDRIHLDVPAARDLAERALAGLGYDAGEARIIADHVIDAALCGYEYSGLAKILNVAESPRFKAPRRPMSVLRDLESFASVSRQRHLMTLFVQRLLQQFSHSPLVLDDQNLHVSDRNKES